VTGISRAIFLDRDGVINENRPDYVKSLAELVILPGALDGLRLLAGLGMPIVVVSNQSAINRGRLAWETVTEITDHLLSCIRSGGGRIDAVFYCPHRPDEGCDCRKPRPGLLYQAAGQLNLQLAGSYLIGDAPSDVRAALAVGATPIMVTTGRGRAELAALTAPLPPEVVVCEHLLAAAGWISDREMSGRATPIAINKS
jgi:D-glycero-D-manno-heptose 1,7-bisphosphate phosphatase